MRYGERVLERKNVQEPNRPAVRPALLGGRQAGTRYLIKKNVPFGTTYMRACSGCFEYFFLHVPHKFTKNSFHMQPAHLM